MDKREIIKMLYMKNRTFKIYFFSRIFFSRKKEHNHKYISHYLYLTKEMLDQAFFKAHL